MKLQIKHVFLNKTELISIRLQEHIPSFHNLVARGESTFDGYNVMTANQNPYGENEWDFYF